MSNERIRKLPVDGTGCGGIHLASNGIELSVEFEYHRSGKRRRGVVKFLNISAFRFRDEVHSADFLEAAYDSVVTLDQTPWFKELLDIEPTDVSGIKEKQCFAVFFSNNGYVEVIGSGVEIIDET